MSEIQDVEMTYTYNGEEHTTYRALSEWAKILNES
jgi:hypothetical protein